LHSIPQSRWQYKGTTRRNNEGSRIVLAALKPSRNNIDHGTAFVLCLPRGYRGGHSSVGYWQSSALNRSALKAFARLLGTGKGSSWMRAINSSAHNKAHVSPREPMAVQTQIEAGDCLLTAFFCLAFFTAPTAGRRSTVAQHLDWP